MQQAHLEQHQQPPQVPGAASAGSATPGEQPDPTDGSPGSILRRAAGVAAAAGGSLLRATLSALTGVRSPPQQQQQAAPVQQQQPVDPTQATPRVLFPAMQQPPQMQQQTYGGQPVEITSTVQATPPSAAAASLAAVPADIAAAAAVQPAAATLDEALRPAGERSKRLKLVLADAPKFSGQMAGELWLAKLEEYITNTVPAYPAQTLLADFRARSMVYEQLLSGDARSSFEDRFLQQVPEWHVFVQWLGVAYRRPHSITAMGALQALRWTPSMEENSLQKFNGTFNKAVAAVGDLLVTDVGLATFYVTALEHHPTLRLDMNIELNSAELAGQPLGLQQIQFKALARWDAYPPEVRQRHTAAGGGAKPGSGKPNAQGGHRWQPWRNGRAGGGYAGGGTAPAAPAAGINAAMPPGSSGEGCPSGWRPGCAVCGDLTHKFAESPACQARWQAMTAEERNQRRLQYGMGSRQPGEGRRPARGN